MAEVFISYAREDLGTVQNLAHALQQAGRSVFWDRTIPPGLTWRDYIGRALDEAGCMIVAWSATSIESEWVLEEAEVGKERKALIPVLVDSVSPPLGFRAIQALDLSAWDGGTDSPDFEQLVKSVTRVLEQSREPEAVDYPDLLDDEGDQNVAEGLTQREDDTENKVAVQKFAGLSFRWRLKAGAVVGCSCALLAGIFGLLIYANDSRDVSDLWVGGVVGAIFAGILWAAAGVIAGLRMLPLVSAAAFSLIVLTLWIWFFGTYADVLWTAVVIGWPLGGIVGAGIGLGVIKFHAGLSSN